MHAGSSCFEVWVNTATSSQGRAGRRQFFCDGSGYESEDVDSSEEEDQDVTDSADDANGDDPTDEESKDPEYEPNAAAASDHDQDAAETTRKRSSRTKRIPRRLGSNSSILYSGLTV